MLSLDLFSRWMARELKERNFSIYGQWLGILGMLLCFATGISGIFSIRIIAFAIVAIVIGVCLLFLEIPLLFKCCPSPSWFKKAICAIEGNWQHALFHIAASVPMFASATFKVSSLIATGIVLLVAGICFLLAFIKGQVYTSSKVLGGGGVANMVV